MRSFIEYIVGELNGDYLVVGSAALAICDFPMNREVHDLDIEIKVSDRGREILRGMSLAFDNSAEYSNTNHIRLNWKGLVTDVWFVNEIDKQFVWKDYIKYAGVSEVLKEKFRYARRKDVEDLIYALSEMASYLSKEDEECKMRNMRDEVPEEYE